MSLQPCGTSAAYQRHLKDGTPVCEACAAARAELKRRPEVLAQNRLYARARKAAMTALSHLYPDEYRRLYEQAKADFEWEAVLKEFTDGA